jgi:hypothetical protein
VTALRRGLGSAASLLPVLPEITVARPARRLTGRWAELPVEPAGATTLGLSFRPLQARALGLDPERSLAELLTFPFGVIRLAAYWSQLESRPGQVDLTALDRQVDAAAAAGKKIILCVGAVKAFGYPEFFVPAHWLPEPLPEGQLITRQTHAALAAAAAAFTASIVTHYRTRPEIVAWQVEHEPADPLGMEHSWRLSAAFVRSEVEAVRAADPTRPVLLSGFLPTSTPVRAQQWWRTRDQGDSLAVAAQLADIVGLNYYPRHGLIRVGSYTAYLAGTRSRWRRRAGERLAASLAAPGRTLMVTECQAEPWETVTTPPSEPGRGMYSCLPEHVIGNYNAAIRLGAAAGGLQSLLFWGAEYWLKRRDQGDDRYLAAFARVLAGSQPGR